MIERAAYRSRIGDMARRSTQVRFLFYEVVFQVTDGEASFTNLSHATLTRCLPLSFDHAVTIYAVDTIRLGHLAAEIDRQF